LSGRDGRTAQLRITPRAAATVRLELGDDPAQLRKVVEQSRSRSAVFDIITNGVPVSIEVDAR
jgi:hypothetical protein